MSPLARPESWRTVAAYAAMIAAALGAFLWVAHVGGSLQAPVPAEAAAAASHGPHPQPLARVLLALLTVTLAARALGWAFRRVGQPPVVGEVVAGILLGPSVLGRLLPEATAFLFPRDVLPLLGVLSQVGVILFMFLVGLQLDAGHLRERGRSVVAISHASIVVPFVLGSALALVLYPRVSTSDVPFTNFALFLGVAMSITAFPVLARILRDRGLDATRIGALAISCAAVDDVTAWCLLALVAAVARHQAGAALVTAGLALAYVVFMFGVVRPLLRRLVRQVERSDAGVAGAVAAVLIGLVASALATEAIGIHAVFGAFFLGALVPHDCRLARELAGRIEDLVIVLLLPGFFAVTGLRTQLGLVGDLDHWLLCLAILAVACLGKVGGAMAAARLTGLAWREAAALGVLMNTRGLMELIVLNVGLDLGLVSGTLFAMMVFMAIVTTVATGPLLAALGIGRPGDGAGGR